MKLELIAAKVVIGEIDSNEVIKAVVSNEHRVLTEMQQGIV